MRFNRISRGKKRLPNISLWRGRAGKVGRYSVLVVAVIAAIGQLRQSEIFYPVAVPFDRALYSHWADDDGDCQDTRQEVLIAESLVPPKLDARGCTVVSGDWFDPFTGHTLTNPKLLDVDHRVPLAEANRSGADRWSADRRAAFANDLSHPDTLIAVDRSANRSKSDGDPLSWMPPNWMSRCAYLLRWWATKQRWALAEDLLEGWYIDAHLGLCRLIGANQDPLVE